MKSYLSSPVPFYFKSRRKYQNQLNQNSQPTYEKESQNEQEIKYVVFDCCLIVICSDTACTAPAAPANKLVYYFTPSLSDEFQAVSADLMVKDGKELGYDIKSLNAVVNATTQISQIEDALGQKPAAIILNAVDTATISNTVEKAKKAGVAVFVYDRFIKDTKTDFHSVVGTIQYRPDGSRRSCKTTLPRNMVRKRVRF